MGVEDKIKELERQLNLKKAYLAVKISFPAGNKFPEDVKKEVTDRLSKACELLAEGGEEGIHTDGLSTEEVSVLKTLYNTLIARTPEIKTASTPVVPEVKEPIQTQDAQRAIDNGTIVSSKLRQKAQIMLTEHIDPTMRKKISPMMQVLVLEEKEDQVFVEEMSSRSRFWIPADDLEF